MKLIMVGLICAILIPVNLAAFSNGQILHLTEGTLLKRGLIRDIIDNILQSNYSSIPQAAGHDINGSVALRSETRTNNSHDSLFRSAIRNFRSKVQARKTRMKLRFIMNETLELKGDLKNRDHFRILNIHQKHAKLVRVIREWNKVSQDYQDISRDNWENLWACSSKKEYAALRKFHDDLYEQLIHVRAFLLDCFRVYEREKQAPSRTQNEIASEPILEVATEALEDREDSVRGGERDRESPQRRLYRIAYFSSFDMWHSPLY